MPHSPSAPDVVIAVPTYRRNDLLRRLLPRLVDQLADVTDITGNRRILVADNDPDGGAEQDVRRIAAENVISLDYVHVPTPGVAAARNTCLAEARPGELLTFIDDDQIPRAQWLRHLLLARARTGSDAIAGPCRPVYSTAVAPWIEQGPFHDAADQPRDTRMTLTLVTNCLFDMDVIRAHGLEFPQIGTRGGEDNWFTTELSRRGGTITWEPGAIVDEPVPPSRTSPRWVLTRSLGNGVIAGRLGVRSSAGSVAPRARLRYTGAGLARVAAGTARAGVALIRRDQASLGGGLHTLARGAGMTVGAWDLVFDEYARDGAHRWHVDRDPRY